MMCPPVFCSRPVLLPGSCCPTCVNRLHEDCLIGNQSNVVLLNNSCLYSGKLYKNGDSWPLMENGNDPHSSQKRGGCTSCKCKVWMYTMLDGQLCRWSYVHRFVTIEVFVFYGTAYIYCTKDVEKVLDKTISCKIVILHQKGDVGKKWRDTSNIIRSGLNFYKKNAF